MPKLTPIVPDSDSALYMRYQSQSDRQPVRLCLDLETGEMRCYAWAEIGPGRTMRAHDGVDIEWDIPPLRRDAVRRMYERIADSAQTLLDGAEVWGGRVTLSDAADPR